MCRVYGSHPPKEVLQQQLVADCVWRYVFNDKDFFYNIKFTIILNISDIVWKGHNLTVNGIMRWNILLQ